MISDPLANVLRSGRAEFNARFEAARQRYPLLDGAAFARFLEETVDPLARGAADIDRDRVPDVVSAVYDAGLELMGQRLIGHQTHERAIETGLLQLAKPLLPLVVQAPARILPALCNALYNLTQTPGARPHQWIADLGRIAGGTTDPDQLLRLGQILGWRAGLAHYREGALAAAQSLSSVLALAAVGAPTQADWSVVAGRLAIDPWYDPARDGMTPAAERRRIAIVGRVGAFRGIGGTFLEPPQVASTADRILVKSGDDHWGLWADVFGATLHRATAEEFVRAQAQPFAPNDLRYAGTTVIWRDRSLDLDHCGGVASAAATTTTLAVASPVSFAVTLVAGT